MTAPMPQVRRVRDPDMRTQWRHGAMNQSPESIDSSGKKGCILVVWRHNDAKSLEGPKVFCEGQRNTRAAARIGSESNRVLLEFRNERNARILDPPQFFREPFGVRRERRFAVDLPAIDTVDRASSTEMRKATKVFHAAQKKSGTVGQPRSACVKNAIHGIRPILCG